MAKNLLCIFCLFPFFVKAQNDLLILNRRGKEILSFRTGNKIKIETTYQQIFEGYITDMHKDSIFINGQAWHYKEIAAIMRLREGSGFLLFGSAMMVAGSGMFILGAVNGLRRGDSLNEWYTSFELISGPLLIAAGYLLRQAYYIKYKIGRKFTLQYLELNPTITR